MQVFFLKLNKLGGVKSWKFSRFAYFWAYIFARTARKLERYCKKKIIICNQTELDLESHKYSVGKQYTYF